MVSYAVILISLLLLTSSCAPVPRHLTGAHAETLTDIYHQSTSDAKKDVGKFFADHFRKQQAFGYVKPYVPVIEPPVVKKVWIPDQRSSQEQGVLIAGHWAYVMIEGPKWFIDEEIQTPVLPVVVPGKDAVREINQH